MSQERFMFVQDDDCHWYCIPVSKEELFDELLGSCLDSTEEFELVFEKYIVGSHISRITFTDPLKVK